MPVYTIAPIQASSFFNSNTVPLKISFLNSDPCGDNIDIIFKVDDIISRGIIDYVIIT